MRDGERGEGTLEREGVDGEVWGRGGGHGDVEVFGPAVAFDADPFVFICRGRWGHSLL